MSLKITPGPWTASIGRRGAHINIANNYNHPLSFGFQYSENDVEQQAEGQANARAIAEVPAMIEAIHELLRVNHEPSGPVSGNIVTGDQRADAGDRARAILKRIES